MVLVYEGELDLEVSELYLFPLECEFSVDDEQELKELLDSKYCLGRELKRYDVFLALLHLGVL